MASTPQATQPFSPAAGTSPPAAPTAEAQGLAQESKPPVVLNPTSPAEPAKEGDGAATPSAVANTPSVATPAVPVPAGEPRLLRLDVSCQVGTHLMVLRMPMTANNTIMSLISKARERASAPGLAVASMWSSHMRPRWERCYRRGSSGSFSVKAPALLRLLTLALCRGQCRAFSLPTSAGATVVALALSAHS